MGWAFAERLLVNEKGRLEHRGGVCKSAFCAIGMACIGAVLVAVVFGLEGACDFYADVVGLVGGEGL